MVTDGVPNERPASEADRANGATEADRASQESRRLGPPASSDRQAARVSLPESVAEQLTAIVDAATTGERLGSKEELRKRLKVSVGTFNCAIRIAQSRGVISIRPGAGGGIFAAAQSPMVRLGNSVFALDADGISVAEAVRIRGVLDPLLIEDALWHASPADIAEMREIIVDMTTACDHDDPTAFVHANWQLQARIAAVSPHPVLRSLYVNMLEQIESHILDVLPVSDQALPAYMAERLMVHAAIVDALEGRDREVALRLTIEHKPYPTWPRPMRSA
jgi:DNA-binding FadR family transcriptional regulator